MNFGVRLRGPRQNSQILYILTSFVCYYSLILATGEIGTFRELRGPVTGTSSELAYLVHSGQFSMLLLTDFGYLSGTNVRVLRGPVTGTSSNLADLVHFVQFCVLLLTKFKYGAIRTFLDLWRPLEGPRQSSQIGSILADRKSVV